MKHLILTASIIGCTTVVASASIISVPGDQRTISQAIGAANPNDTILIEDGTYREQIDFGGVDLVVASRFLLDRDRDHITSTIIDGDHNGTVINCVSDETSGTKLIGLSIRNGTGRIWIYEDRTFFHGGGAIFIKNASPTFLDCNIYGNTVEEEGSLGGGVYCSGSSSVFERCWIKANTAGEGGGIYAEGGDIELRNCRFTSNHSNWDHGGGAQLISGGHLIETCYFDSNTTTTGDGAGAFVSGGSLVRNSVFVANHSYDGGGLYCGNAVIENCVFAENSVDRWGGAIFGIGGPTSITDCLFLRNHSAWDGGALALEYSDPLIRRCLFIDNTADRNGGALYSWDEANPLFYNSAAIGNHAASAGFAYCSDASSPLVNSSIIIENTMPSFVFDPEDAPGLVSVAFCDFEGGRDAIQTNGNGYIDWGRGNIDLDPRFVAEPDSDYQLSENSPCIDSGDPNFPNDPDSTRTDMGAYYHDQANRVTEGDPIPSVHGLLALYPNPFNSLTEVSFVVNTSKHVTLKVYSLLGEELETIVESELPAGNYSYRLNGSNLSTGIYLVRLNIGGREETAGAVLLR